MKSFYPHSWVKKLNVHRVRYLTDYSEKIDFASNDYLGFAKQNRIKKILESHFESLFFQGSTGSRLISGNRKWIESIELVIANYHRAESAIIYPSAYQANVGLFSCLASRSDLYLIDESIHASIIDGIRLSFAKCFKFRHNDVDELKTLIERHYRCFENIFVVVEGLYSMDGDACKVQEILKYIDNQKIFLIVDEAHSFGIMGEDRLGVFHFKPYSDFCLARIIGYGKALGFSGASIVGSRVLKEYLINFSRSLIYSTALPFYHYQLVALLYEELISNSESEYKALQKNIEFYLNEVGDTKYFSKHATPIQYFLIRKEMGEKIQEALLKNGIYAKVIFPPTVPDGKERVRISLHAFNTFDEIKLLVNTLKKFEE